MSDIVGRLRKENSMPPYYGPPKLQEDAAAEIERLRAALEPFACRCSQKGEGAGGTCLAPGGICRAWNARAELEGK